MGAGRVRRLGVAARDWLWAGPAEKVKRNDQRQPTLGSLGKSRCCACTKEKNRKRAGGSDSWRLGAGPATTPGRLHQTPAGASLPAADTRPAGNSLPRSPPTRPPPPSLLNSPYPSWAGGGREADGGIAAAPRATEGVTLPEGVPRPQPPALALPPGRRGTRRRRRWRQRLYSPSCQ